MTRPTRRSFVSAAIAATTAGLVRSGAAIAVPAPAGLKDYAAPARLIFGSAIALENLPLDECRALYEREARIVTTDLALKFAILRSGPDAFNFAPADAVTGWARRAGLLVRGHTLIWNEDNGNWLKGRSASEIEWIFDEHIERVVSRYAGRIHTWDVVNEPFCPEHGEPGGYRRGPWYDALGPRYIERALKRVRSIDKEARLCVNEAGVHSDDASGRAVRPCLARLAETLRHEGTPFDVVGLECHLQPASPYDYRGFGEYMRGLASNGIELDVTEFDVNDASFPSAVVPRDDAVAAHAASFLDAVLAVPALSMFITWELADHWSWLWHLTADIDPHAPRLPRPLPFDDHLNRKPLWYALARGFDRRAAL